MIAYIDENRERFGVEPICRLLPIAPSTYYEARSRPPSARRCRDEELKVKIARGVLELPGTPTHRITVDPTGATWCYAGDVEGGTGIELTTQQPLRVTSVDSLGP